MIGRLLAAGLMLTACGSTAATVASSSVAAHPSLTPSATAAPTLSDTPAPTPTPTAAPQSVGTTITTTLGNTLQLVTWAQPIASGNEFETPSATGGSFGGAELHVCAGAGGNLHINPLFFVAVMPDDTQIQSTLIEPSGKAPLNDTTLNAGQCVRGWVFFDLPGRPRLFSVSGQSDVAWTVGG